MFKSAILSAPVLFVACLHVLCSKSAIQPYTAVKVFWLEAELVPNDGPLENKSPPYISLKRFTG